MIAGPDCLLRKKCAWKEDASCGLTAFNILQDVNRTRKTFIDTQDPQLSINMDSLH